MRVSSTAHKMNRSSFRLLIAIPLGLITAFALFAFMSWMVGSVKTNVSGDQAPLAFDVIMQEQDSDSQRRQRPLPEPPKVPEQPQQLATPQTPTAAMPQVQAPQVAIDTTMTFSDSNVAINMPAMNINHSSPVAAGQIGTGVGQQQQAMPLYRAEPAYPSRMLKRRVEGFVVMSFTINEQGRPEDIQVVQAEPSKAFVRPAVQALRNWKYQPQIEGGKAVKQPGQQVKIEFKINR
ncbi:energy transducer TonB [Vibrio aphrogenes]|uniref:energy transducer TonB n=1 Tax=Vibrio aphrogenes TaxID=1891186 RepID=UPI000B350688|nr:energy transducer TonB [Vibrio aphrogenes]